MRYILSIDQSTQSTCAVLYDENLNIIFSAAKSHRQIYPEPGWVEHDAAEIWRCVKDTVCSVVSAAKEDGISPEAIVCIGLANQGETVVAWDSRTGEPLYNAIVWQDKRTDDMVRELKKKDGLEEAVHTKTGLYIDSYFSALKMKWLIKNIPEAQEAQESRTLMIGTLDSYLIYKMTGGKSFVTDVSAASRTMLFNINTLGWDDEILTALNIDRRLLPNVLSTCADYGKAADFCGLDAHITAGITDQQAALFGHGCTNYGDVKCTYGTGCFILGNVGDKPILSKSELLTTIAWQIGGSTSYALDGGVYMAGAAFRWLKEKLGLISDYRQIDELAYKAKRGSEYFVTAFTGLGAPHWESAAKGCVVGLGLDSGKEEIARAVCESIAYRVDEVLGCMKSDMGSMGRLKADGGVTKSRYLMQFQADISGEDVAVASDFEMTSRGTAMFAGLGADIWESVDKMPENISDYKTYEPKMSEGEREKLKRGWKDAVESCINASKPKKLP